jgi:hypothetical protein
MLSLLFAQGLNDNYGGTWEGNWFNNTFQSTGPIYMEIYINESTMTFMTYTDIGGNVFGLTDPPPVTGQGSFTNTGVLSVVTQGPILGDVTMTLDTNTGELIIEAIPNPVTGIATYTVTGTVSPQAMDLEFNLTFQGGGGANGTIDLTKNSSTTPFLEIGGETGLPEMFALKQNYPNPFNPSTTIRYDLKEGGFVTLIVYDMLGREIRKIVNEYQDPGHHSALWDGRNNSGRLMSGGVYLYSIQVGQYQETRKMLLVK